jgi:hypothetical protein
MYPVRLIHRVCPMPHEDAYGFLMRVAAANYWSGADKLLEHCAGRSGQVIYLSDLPAITHFCRNTAEESMRLFGVVSKSQNGRKAWHFAGGTLTQAPFVSYRLAKACPLCLKEAPYIRGLWRLSFYLVCHKHRIKLISQCPSCGHKPVWFQGTTMRCSCASIFDNFVLEPASREALQVSQLLAGYFEDTCIDRTVHQVAIERLAGLSINSLCQTIWFLGHCVPDIGKYGLGHGRAVPSPEEAERMITKTLRFLNGWPNSLGMALAEIASRQPSQSSASLIDRLMGPLQHYLYEVIEEEELAFLRTAYEQHVQAIWKQLGARRTNHSMQLELSFDVTSKF